MSPSPAPRARVGGRRAVLLPGHPRSRSSLGALAGPRHPSLWSRSAAVTPSRSGRHRGGRRSSGPKDFPAGPRPPRGPAPTRQPRLEFRSRPLFKSPVQDHAPHEKGRARRRPRPPEPQAKDHAPPRKSAPPAPDEGPVRRKRQPRGDCERQAGSPGPAPWAAWSGREADLRCRWREELGSRARVEGRAGRRVPCGGSRGPRPDGREVPGHPGRPSTHGEL